MNQTDEHGEYTSPTHKLRGLEIGYVFIDDIEAEVDAELAARQRINPDYLERD